MPMIKISADANKAAELLNAFTSMDGREKIQNVNGQDQLFRVPFVLGPIVRLAIVRNMVELRKHVVAFDEVKKSILKSLWPDAPDLSQSIPIADFPTGVFIAFKDQTTLAATANIDQISLMTIDENQLTKGNSEFSIDALACLLENGLIIADEQPATKRKK